jgi:hypothetical protein
VLGILGALIGACAFLIFNAWLAGSIVLIANRDSLRWAFCHQNLLNTAPVYLIDSTTAIFICGM